MFVYLLTVRICGLITPPALELVFRQIGSCLDTNFSSESACFQSAAHRNGSVCTPEILVSPRIVGGSGPGD